MALSAARQTPRSDKTVFPAPVKAGGAIHEGAMLVWDGGYVKPAAKEANAVFAGRAEQSIPSVDKNGDAVCLVARGGAFRWKKAATVVQAKMGASAYIVDDETVTDVAAGSSKIGTLLELDGDEVWVI